MTATVPATIPFFMFFDELDGFRCALLNDIGNGFHLFSGGLHERLLFRIVKLKVGFRQRCLHVLFPLLVLELKLFHFSLHSFLFSVFYPVL